MQAGEAGVAVGLLDEALALADPAAEPVRAGILHSQRAWYSWAAGMAGPEMHEHHARALALIPPEPPSKARAQAVTDLAFTDMLDGRMSEALERAQEAVALARDAGAREIEGLALNVLGCARGMQGENEAAIECLRTAVAIARETDGTEALGRAYVNLSAQLDIAGRYEEAVEVALEGVATSRRLGLDRHWSAFLAGNAAESMITLGRLEEASALVDDTLAGEVSEMAASHLTLLNADIALQRGDLAAAETALAAAREHGVLARMAEMAGSAAQIAAEVAIAQGRHEEARAAVREGLERLTDDWRVIAALVAAGVAAGDEPAELLERLDDLGPAADVPLARAFTLTAHAEAQSAPEPWRAAAETWEALPVPYRAGRARLREAEALLDAGAGREEAAGPLRAAAAAARSIGALRPAARGRAARGAGADRRRRGARGRTRAGLTPREREVLVHLAAGRTNRQIAEALYISPRTAGVHVSRILAKLGATTRGEAAAAGRLAGVIDEERVEALLTRSTG